MHSRSRGARHPTLKDVAEAAATSRSTTSRALSGSGYVSNDVRDRVLQAAKDLGYTPDIRARSLKQQRSSLIGILVPDLSNSYYARLAAGASSRLRKQGFETLLTDSLGQDNEIATAELFSSLRVAGAIVAPLRADTTTRLRDHGVALVEADHHSATDGVDAVRISDVSSALEMTRALLAHGYRDIALLLETRQSISMDERAEGFRRALKEAGITPQSSRIIHAGQGVEGAETAVRAVLAETERPQAIFTASNVLAEGTWRAIRSCGLQLPHDIGLASFHQAKWMTMVEPGITTLGPDAREVGQAAADLLLERLGDPIRRRRVLELSTEIRWRGSTRTLA